MAGQANLLRDFGFAEDAGGSIANLVTAKLTGLKRNANDLVRVWSCDPDGNAGSASRRHLNNPALDDPDSIIRTMLWNVGNPNVPDAGLFSFTLTPDSPSITLTATDGDGYPSGNVSGLVFFNGMTIEAVPEPPTVALLGLAAFGLGGYVRRRREPAPGTIYRARHERADLRVRPFCTRGTVHDCLVGDPGQGSLVWKSHTFHRKRPRGLDPARRDAYTR